MDILSEGQLDSKIKFLDDYAEAVNPASASMVDANSNVTEKSLATAYAELYKDYNIQMNRRMSYDKIRKMYGKKLADKYLEDLNDHLIYVNDESSLFPYCTSISLYPFLIYGTKCLSGVSDAPKNLQSFCGSFVNCIYQIASSFAGAVATVEFLHCFDYFARKQYGHDYLATNKKEVAQELQGVVYALNQPASARGNQSVFWNISVFDKYYMEAMFGDFFYPDGTQIDFDSVRELQKFFMEWFRKEREKSLLTFPVLTASCLEKEDKTGFRDEEFIDFLCEEMEKGLSFFIYESTSADSLSSCCRLKNEITENEFSYTLGAGGVMTGSVQVITLNANRLVQKYGMNELEPLINRMHKYLTAYREIYSHYIDLNMLPPYKAGFISLDKQFITIGVNGLVEAAEYLGYDISPNKYYMDFCAKFLGTIKALNTKYKQTTGIKVNTEMIPAENLGVKNAKWDRKAGLVTKRDCYNSYFYIVEDENTTLLDKFKMHGSEITDYLDGGSALHANLEHLMTKEQAKKLFYIAMQSGVPYWTFNVRMTCCNSCGHIDAETYTQCPKCGSKDIDYATRVIGYLKKITNFSEKRQEEAERRFYE